MRSV
jgi:hypothetical protein